MQSEETETSGQYLSIKGHSNRNLLKGGQVHSRCSPLDGLSILYGIDELKLVSKTQQ